ncbi:hypothetical protein EYF80_004526 [Liparis tanakae]|uniref:Uncharacterized protein n=1 Tax=Liparis tanakae TaxID=230148 RepID=A0A4Z2J4S3_9TELE|nr:hypothetical protein EYF80_004526 [Liparis tanakae]
MAPSGPALPTAPRIDSTPTTCRALNGPVWSKEYAADKFNFLSGEVEPPAVALTSVCEERGSAQGTLDFSGPLGRSFLIIGAALRGAESSAWRLVEPC